MTTFSAQVDDIIRKSKERMEAVFKQSVQDTVEIMQTPVAKGGNIPVDTGFLRSSLQGGLNTITKGQSVKPDAGTFTYNGTQMTMVIAGAELGDSIYATYSANYAKYVHDGANGRPGRPWVRLAAQQWPATVEKVAGQVRQRVQ